MEHAPSKHFWVSTGESKACLREFAKFAHWSCMLKQLFGRLYRRFLQRQAELGERDRRTREACDRVANREKWQYP